MPLRYFPHVLLYGLFCETLVWLLHLDNSEGETLYLLVLACIVGYNLWGRYKRKRDGTDPKTLITNLTAKLATMTYAQAVAFVSQDPIGALFFNGLERYQQISIQALLEMRRRLETGLLIEADRELVVSELAKSIALAKVTRAGIFDIPSGSGPASLDIASIDRS